MKRFAVIFVTLFITLGASMAQSVIDDYPYHIEVITGSDTISYPKPSSGVFVYDIGYGDKVFVDYDNRDVVKFDYNDFDAFSSKSELCAYLRAIFNKKYDLRLVYDGSGNNDTVYYDYDGTTEFISVMTYSGSDLATQKYVTQ